METSLTYEELKDLIFSVERGDISAQEGWDTLLLFQKKNKRDVLERQTKEDKDEVIVKGVIEREDRGAREFLSILEKKITNINNRTKAHTVYIMELQKKVKELEK